MRLIVLLLLFIPFAASAQPGGKMPRLCMLVFGSADKAPAIFEPFLNGLRDLGYVDKKNILLDIRGADSVGERFPVLAKECVAGRSDVIVVTTTPAAQAAKQATSTIPIVMHPLGDPVGTGLVRSLASPGGL